LARLYRRHCEEQSDEAIHTSACREMDCFASVAMTGMDTWMPETPRHDDALVKAP
jgi:mannose-1-phosphate guanylyltransferase